MNGNDKKREKQREYSRKWREKHPERQREINQRSNEKHREQRREASRQYRKEHQEERREYNRRYRKEHPDWACECKRRWERGHREQHLATRRRYYKAHKETILAKHKEYRERPEVKTRLSQARIHYGAKLRQDMLDHYGNKCICCGETIKEFLCIDHINGGGNAHRRKINKGSGGVHFYAWLKEQNYPQGYRVLCFNCNTSLGWLGYCPHQKGTK